MDSAEPIPVIPLEYAKPTTVPRRLRWLRVAQWAVGLAALDVFVGLILIPVVDTESVGATGPILFVLGAALVVTSMKLKLLPGAMLGLAHCAVPLLFTMLVNVLRWGPNDASIPFLVMGGAYLLGVVLPGSVLFFLRTLPLADAMRGSAPVPPADLPSTGRPAEDAP